MLIEEKFVVLLVCADITCVEKIAEDNLLLILQNVDVWCEFGRIHLEIELPACCTTLAHYSLTQRDLFVLFILFFDA